MKTQIRARQASLALLLAAFSTGCSAAAGDAFSTDDHDASPASPPSQVADGSTPSPDGAVVPTIDAGWQADASTPPDAAQDAHDDGDASDGSIEAQAEAGPVCA